jgi:hypothetical protein
VAPVEAFNCEGAGWCPQLKRGFVRQQRREEIMPKFVSASILVSGVLALPLPRLSQPRIPGCYHFSHSYFGWLSDNPIRPDSSDVIELLADPNTETARSGGVFGVRVPAMPDVAESARRRRFSFWQSSAANSIRLEWRNGFYGPVFDLQIQGDSLVGSLEQTTDVRSMDPPIRQAARAARVRCPQAAGRR